MQVREIKQVTVNTCIVIAFIVKLGLEFVWISTEKALKYLRIRCMGRKMHHVLCTIIPLSKKNPPLTDIVRKNSVKRI